MGWLAERGVRVCKVSDGDNCFYLLVFVFILLMIVIVRRIYRAGTVETFPLVRHILPNFCALKVCRSKTRTL
jgi:hypothetical protein